MKNTCDPCPSCPAAEVDPGLAFLALPLVQPTGKVMGGVVVLFYNAESGGEVEEQWVIVRKYQ